MQPNHTKMRFPLWKFLNQPLFDRYGRTSLNPRRFWYRHQVEWLESCLMVDCASKDGRLE